MISIYCDEDVDILIKPLLEAKGFKVLTTLDEKMLGASDIQQINHAVEKEYAFLTHNRLDFERLCASHINDGKNHYGVIIATRRNAYDLAKRISRVLSGYTEETIKNQLLYI
ncbi:MAG: hypothetical protein C0415_03310 [Thermodesulfovibrio sp.]|nr:hypothetical protein [Thermodesulfovibrio sp.]